MEEMIKTIQTLVDRIENLEKINKTLIDEIKKIKSARTEKVETSVKPKKDIKKDDVVGSLVFDGKYVKTSGYLNSKARYAIMVSITEKFNGVKLGKGNEIYEKCRKEDKYVQVYEFKSVKDCEKFKKDQEKRMD